MLPQRLQTAIGGHTLFPSAVERFGLKDDETVAPHNQFRIDFHEALLIGKFVPDPEGDEDKRKSKEDSDEGEGGRKALKPKPKAHFPTYAATMDVRVVITPTETPGTIFFPIAYPQLTPRDLEDPNGNPQDINDSTWGPWRLPCKQLQVKSHNTNRLCLYKLGPGAVAFKVVLNAFEVGGMRFTPGENWNVLWAKRVKPHEWLNMNRYQHINHFPGTWGIGRKDNLHLNVTKMRHEHGAAAFDFCPKTFIIPGEKADMEADMATNPGGTYISKPVASSCGKGIKLTKEIPLPPKPGKSVLVQRYVGNPLLIDGRKFDLRMYAVVSSFDPLRLYVFDEGLVRFAAQRYPGADELLDNNYMHLTNYSVNKTQLLRKSSKGKGEDSEDPLDIKWTLTTFRQWIRKQFKDSAEGDRRWAHVLAQVDDIIVKTFLSIYKDVTAQCQKCCSDPTGRGCFELFGLDLMLDDQYKVYLIECNIMPSLATQGALDKAVKGRVLAHLLTLIGIIPYKRDAEKEESRTPRPPMPTDTTFSMEKLSPAEAEIIVEAENELFRCGGFRRVFPTPHTKRQYKQFFPYFSAANELLAWVEELKNKDRK